MAQRSEREGDCLGVAVAQGEGAEVDDVATRVCFPATTGALEAHLEQTLAGGLDVTGADGESESSRHLIPHVFAVIFEIRDGLMHGATVSDAHGLLLAAPKGLQNLLDRVLFVEQTQSPGGQLRGASRVAMKHLRRTPKLL